LRQANHDWKKMNPNKKPLVVLPPDNNDDEDYYGKRRGRVVPLENAQYWSETGFSYVVIIKSLKAKRFYNVTEEDIREFQTETEESEDIVFVGPVNGIAVCREILENSAEEPVMHPVIEMPEPFSKGKSEWERYSSRGGVSFLLVDCGHPDCSGCYGQLKSKPNWYITGFPADDAPEVIELRTRQAKIKKLKRRRKIAQMSFYNIMLLTMMDNNDYDDDDEQIRAEAIKELEKQEEN